MPRPKVKRGKRLLALRLTPRVQRPRSSLLALAVMLALLSACGPRAQPPAPSPLPTPQPTATPRPAAVVHSINPLSGQRVADPSLLKIPALLVSISNFPAASRPQAGLSFAPFVYEFYITEGATRFLAVFHGEFPRPELPITGNCETRIGPFVKTALLLGNRVWLDANANGLQDPGEEGISGLCVNLFDAAGSLIQRASTDSNGYYGFNVQPGRYSVEFETPAGFGFTAAHKGRPTVDSDADPASGRAQADLSADDLTIDAGLVPSSGATPTPDPLRLALPQVGPVRSGRLIYSYIASYFENSCLVYAFASEEVLARLPQCHMVFHQLEAGGYMMGLDEMRSVAQDTLHASASPFNYASNAYSDQPPSGGQPASLLKVFFAYQNQSGWAYDPLSQAYLRYVDTSEYETAGQLHPDTDRLNGRQLHFENLVVLYAEHEVISPTNLDIHLNPGRTGKAVLFRDGRMFKMMWSTMPWTGQGRKTRPIRFVDDAGDPVALQPGHTWVIVVTPDSTLEPASAGEWLLTFTQPPGAK